MSPCAASIARLIFDFGATPMYKEAHVFLSGSLAPQLLAEVRSTPGLTARLATLREVHLEFSVVDRRTFITDQVRPYRETVDYWRRQRTCPQQISTAHFDFG